MSNGFDIFILIFFEWRDTENQQYWRALPRDTTLYSFICHFWQNDTPFVYLPDKWYSFHVLTGLNWKILRRRSDRNVKNVLSCHVSQTIARMLLMHVMSCQRWQIISPMPPMTKHCSHPTNSKQLLLPETISFITSTTNHHNHCQPCRTTAAMQLLTSHYSHATNEKPLNKCHSQTIK